MGMSREEAIHILDNLKPTNTKSSFDAYVVGKAITMAIKALVQEPCEDAISRDAALEKMADYVASGYADSVEDFEEYSRIICQLPSVNPQPKTGHWIKQESFSGIKYICSACNKKVYLTDYPAKDFVKHNYAYCPNCGTKMVEPQESEE